MASELQKTVNSILDKMHSQKVATDKGSFGERAVFEICKEYYNNYGAILYHSYTYKTVSNQKGNIEKDSSGNLKVNKLSGFTEIDILLVTEHRIFPIEVKAYKSKKIILLDREIQGVFADKKSPEHQNDMHARHLYPQIFTVIPEGKTEYIIPLIVFVDECTVIDKRSKHRRLYIPKTVLANLKDTILKYNVPLESRIDMPLMDKMLRKVCTNSERYLPYVGKQDT